jgi:hypothetical protein
VVAVVVIDGIGLQLLVGALQLHVAGQVIDRLVGAVHVLRVHLGGAGLAQAGVLAEGRIVEFQQRIGPAHRVVVRARRAVKGAQRTRLFGAVERGFWMAVATLGVGLAADQGKCCGNRQQAAWR